ncbi:MAG: dihydrolipoyl dehydrogenase [Chloroflexi bacterium]|nr:dihydrolipoyl dehydrogenase [Chloroflexota bacterium]
MPADTPETTAATSETRDPDTFDLVVIGAGTGGYSAAFRAAQLGLSVALIDQHKIGGTCLHRGCIPTKAMLESADLLDRIRKAGTYGLVVEGSVAGDPVAIATRRQAVVDRLHKGLMSLVRKNQVAYIRGTATLEGATRIRVATIDEQDQPTGERVLTSKDTILATGSRVKSLPGLVPDGERIVTSDDVLRSTDVPASIAVIGAGAVGMEFASYYRDLGAEVTVLEYLPAVVPLEDADVSKEMEKAFTKRGIKIITSARFDPAAVTVDDAGVHILVGKEGAEPSELVVDRLLVAAGRAANTDGVGLETTKAVVERTIVQVDANMQTAEPHLYAIGDIIGGLWLAHVAAHEGIAAVHAIAGEEVEHVDYRKMPRATYSRPQVASIGRTEAECERDGIPVKIGRIPFQAIGKAIANGETEGFTKVIAHAETDELLGVHLIGSHVTELIAEASAAMLFEATAWDLGSAVHPHPTLSEAIGETALAVHGKSINF